jgi:hypothetical protein
VSEYYIAKLTALQLKTLNEKWGQKITHWGDGSVNVEAPGDELDGFIEWCEGQGLAPELI